MYRKPPSGFCDCFTYLMHPSTVSFGTYSPAFRAALNALIWQMVTDRSASFFTGWYRQPPSLFWVSMISCTALRSFSRISGRCVMPYASARNSVPKPCEYIGPCVEEPDTVMKPDGDVFCIT